MNAKKAKAIRRALNANLNKYGLTVKAAVHETSTVRSKHYTVTIYERGGISFSHDDVSFTYRVFTPEKKLENTATQVRINPRSPRAVYRKVKQHVSRQ